MWRYAVQGKNRRGWLQKIFGAVDARKSNGPCLWFHAVSVGEVNLLAPILRQLKQIQPDWVIVISSTTETGYDLARQKYPEHYIFFCPFDFTWAIKRVLKRLRPNALVLAELELWPNLIQTTRNAGLPIAVINGRLSASSFEGYQKIRWIISPTLKRLSWVAAQNETYARRFRDLGCNPENLCVTGSIKFDGVESDRNNAQTVRLSGLAELIPSDFVWVAGSTQLEEDLILAQTYQRLAKTIPNLKLILVPRHPERCGQLASRLDQLGIPHRFRSQFPNDSVAETGPPRLDSETSLAPVLIVDVIGELGGWWGRADVAYVGGSMGHRGGQNMIEPAAFGTPISFGPHTENFRDIVEEFLEHEAATIVYDAESIQAFVESVFSQPDWAHQIGLRAQWVVNHRAGASRRTVESLCQLIGHSAAIGQTPASNHAA